MAGLVGRDRECEQIDAVLRDARGGLARAFVLRGDPGIGKTALLEYAFDQAPDMLVLRALGVEAESDLAFAGLYGLLRTVAGRLE
jgi:predicted ATP-dependent serine protease